MLELIARTSADVHPVRIDNPALAAFHAYWDEKRGSRAMPFRAELDPAEFRNYLGWIVMAEALPDYSDFRYRLIGTKITRYFQADNTGRTVTDTFRRFGPKTVDSILSVYREATRGGRPVRVQGEADWLDDYQTFDALFLPLSDEAGRSNVLMNVFTFDLDKAIQRSGGMLR